MSAPLDLTRVLGPALRPHPEHVPGWRFWELRTWQLHRVVGHGRSELTVARPAELESLVRGTLERHFPAAWWRGLGFGVVLEVAGLALPPAELVPLIDASNRRRGTWQWLILVPAGEGPAIGVHTWLEGALTPVYRAARQLVTSHGRPCLSLVREQGRLMSWLTSTNRRLAALGLSANPFREFDPRG